VSDTEGRDGVGWEGARAASGKKCKLCNVPAHRCGYCVMHCLCRFRDEE